MTLDELDADRQLRQRIDPLAVQLSTFGKVELATRLYLEAMKDVTGRPLSRRFDVELPASEELNALERGGADAEETRVKAVDATHNSTRETEGSNHDDRKD